MACPTGYVESRTESSVLYRANNLHLLVWNLAWPLRVVTVTPSCDCESPKVLRPGENFGNLLRTGSEFFGMEHAQLLLSLGLWLEIGGLQSFDGGTIGVGVYILAVFIGTSRLSKPHNQGLLICLVLRCGLK